MLEKVRLFFLKTDPWVHSSDKETEGELDVLSTIDIKLPPKPESQLKKVDLLVKQDDEEERYMSLVF